ncbi:Uma2 family endonuclease [Antarcticirhabdus aurantiaca]|uniref:Uma2 family endonuclease n=1 Tax=Antarcticirhabdus aurantiaca TaxID=2606717 RepID=A0ACD4NK13_9HYPH|nr:Uma2 family endonuclease [Antarcticirhabdus aurantiaca]WAJ27081.1 Uma2 family endonuclease [Jeongeuplla avenae]
MSEALSGRRMTPEEFFEWQAEQDRNYELVDGVPVLPVKAMTGASHRHDYVSVNVLTLLRQKLRGKPCRPHTDDIAVRNANRNIRRPDIVVDCRSTPDGKTTEAREPRLLVEVLSPSTTRFDRFQKIEEYKANDSIRVVLLVDTQSPSVIVWRRAADGWRSETLTGLDASIPLPEIEAELAMAEIYEDVPFPAPAD